MVDTKHISVWYDENDISVPMIIYVPRLKHDTFPVDFDPDDCIKNSFCNTFNFSYTKEQARLVCGLTKHIIMAEASTVKDAIAYVLKHKFGMIYPLIRHCIRGTLAWRFNYSKFFCFFNSIALDGVRLNINVTEGVLPMEYMIPRSVTVDLFHCYNRTRNSTVGNSPAFLGK